MVVHGKDEGCHNGVEPKQQVHVAKIVRCSLSIGDSETIEDCELEFSIKKECVVHALQSVLPRNLVKRKISGALNI